MSEVHTAISQQVTIAFNSCVPTSNESISFNFLRHRWLLTKPILDCNFEFFIVSIVFASQYIFHYTKGMVI